MASQTALSGTVHPPHYFLIRESFAFDTDEVIRVLRGEVAGCIFRSIIPPSTCRQIAQNFWQHPDLRQRDDAVPAYILGTYHYGKPLDRYFDEADRYRGAQQLVFDGCENIFHRVVSAVRSGLAGRGVSLRVASHNDRSASEFVMRSWCGRGRFSLEPHDDGAQLACALQRSFEIQKVAAFPVVSVNMCLENPSAGELHYWNIEPDEAARARYGLEETGYPYPVDALDGFEKIVLAVRPGDVYCFAGKHVHAVAAQLEDVGYRSTLSFLMGFCDRATVIYWS
jgi:hypothetical protein